MDFLEFVDFLAKAWNVHESKYDYQYVNYIDDETNVKILCNKCKNIFKTTPYIHLYLKNGGCSKCFPFRKYKKLTTEKIISKLEKKYSNDFDYSEIDYRGVNYPVIIFCKKCGNKFSVLPKEFLRNPKCRTCGIKKKLSSKEYVERAILIHGSKYDYSKIEYRGFKYDIEITCNNCGIHLKINAGNHIRGQGCGCLSSK
ncbi:hypothetical protein QJ850_gp929 [Acanthamoeba polyphaga mimivirus]|uniref:Uncharacterized protein n=1 Tax=Acanthamoeba polyphaga mimivirus Kroon TaxID=3069720 RepID=A0A0G2Y214_9VIRU|nr:hypothetical protein QJ850_gp929 [Acanthamoeba polyphaga mimivirus]AKI79770.1 hypothetical protein [Acanthamoeba polyphaga mimivirus Kroon]